MIILLFDFPIKDFVCELDENTDQSRYISLII